MSDFSLPVGFFGSSHVDAVAMPAGSSEIITLIDGQRYSLFILRGSVVVNREDKKKPWRQITGGPLSPVLLATPGSYSIFAKTHTLAVRVEKG